MVEISKKKYQVGFTNFKVPFGISMSFLGIYETGQWLSALETLNTDMVWKHRKLVIFFSWILLDPRLGEGCLLYIGLWCAHGYLVNWAFQV